MSASPHIYAAFYEGSAPHMLRKVIYDEKGRVVHATSVCGHRTSWRAYHVSTQAKWKKDGCSQCKYRLSATPGSYYHVHCPRTLEIKQADIDPLRIKARYILSSASLPELPQDFDQKNVYTEQHASRQHGLFLEIEERNSTSKLGTLQLRVERNPDTGKLEIEALGELAGDVQFVPRRAA